MYENSDEIIMENIKAGELTGMSVLFERYHRKLFNFFLRMRLDRDTCHDLTQNLFYRMIRYKHTYRSGSSVKTWIYQIARNIYHDHCRNEMKSSGLFTVEESYQADITDEPDGFSEEEYNRLENSLKFLSETQRELIVLSRYQGLKYEEISALTNQSVAAIKVAVHRAVKQLRSVYFKQF